VTYTAATGGPTLFPHDADGFVGHLFVTRDF